MQRKNVSSSNLVFVSAMVALIFVGAGCFTRTDSDQTPPPAPLPPPIEGGNCGDGCEPGYTCIQECGPPVASDQDPPPGYYCERDEVAAQPRNCPICLASNARIATPTGEVAVKDISVGMMVWSVDTNGNRVASNVIAVGSTNAPASHEVVHLVLTDGREIWVSPNHPTADGRRVVELHIGDTYNGSRVRSAERVPYWDDETYDLLVDSETGYYWANDILLGSTLSAD